MKLLICSSVTDLLKCFEHKLKYVHQINSLLCESFPQHFSRNGKNGQPPITIFEQLRNLVRLRKIDDTDIVTFIKFIGEKHTNSNTSTAQEGRVIAFAQLVVEHNQRNYRNQRNQHNSSKLRIINLCRIKSRKFKGQGSRMMKHIIKYLQLNPSPIGKFNKVYLSVSSSNTSLQMYYKALGWDDTYRYDIRSDNPAFEFVMHF